MILAVVLSALVAAGFVCLLVLVRVGVKPEPLVLRVGSRRLQVSADKASVHLRWLPAAVVGNPRVIDGEIVVPNALPWEAQ